MSKNKMRIKNLTFETAKGTQVELSVDEAKELYDQLHQLFGKDTTYVPNPYPVYIDRW